MQTKKIHCICLLRSRDKIGIEKTIHHDIFCWHTHFNVHLVLYYYDSLIWRSIVLFEWFRSGFIFWAVVNRIRHRILYRTNIFMYKDDENRNRISNDLRIHEVYCNLFTRNNKLDTLADKRFVITIVNGINLFIRSKNTHSTVPSISINTCSCIYIVSIGFLQKYTSNIHLDGFATLWGDFRKSLSD